MSASELENFEERAAIVEFEHGWPRPIAEAEARRSVTRALWVCSPARVGWMQPPDGHDADR